MFEAEIFIVWRTAKGRKNIVAIFAEKVEALHNASTWKREAEDAGYRWNYKIERQIIYGSEYPVQCIKKKGI